MKIQIKKLSPTARTPTRAEPGSAGYDLYSDEYAEVQPGERRLISTNISINIPKGYYGRIAPRSGLSLKFGINIMAGVIDSSYRNNIGVLLINLNFNFGSIFRHITNSDPIINHFGMKETLKIYVGDRIGQLIIEKCHDAEWEEVEELEKTERIGGFGSTGV